MKRYGRANRANIAFHNLVYLLLVSSIAFFGRLASPLHNDFA
jgi:hypothetical protein